jgi:hypothetical protein
MILIGKKQITPREICPYVINPTGTGLGSTRAAVVRAWRPMNR